MDHVVIGVNGQVRQVSSNAHKRAQCKGGGGRSKAKPARQYWRTLSGRRGKMHLSHNYATQTWIKRLYVVQNLMKDSQCWSRGFRFVAASVHCPKLVLAARFTFRLPMKSRAPNSMFQPGTNVKFVEPNAVAIGWQNITLTPNSWNHKCATMFWC